jgi:periplasmic protein TonB
VHRFDQRQGFLVSAILHLTLLMVLIAHPLTPRKPDEIDPSTLERKDLVFMPPAALLRQLAPKLPPGARPRPIPAPTPPPADAQPKPQTKDRISVGAPSDLRSKGPMILRRDDDLTAVPKGQMTPPGPVTPPPPAATPAPEPQVAQKGGGAPERPGREGLRLPPGLLGSQMTRGDEGRRAQPGPLGPAIEGAMDSVVRRMQRDAQLGLPTGTGRNQSYGLYFDPQGADFTLWMNTFKNEVYRNWLPPLGAELGFRGHVDFEFTVERDGSMSGLRLLKSSGTASLDRAAQNALSSSRWLPLPNDYGPPRVTMQVSFFYNEAPQGS